MDENFDFWKDATTFVNDLLPKDTEKRIAEHIKNRGFNNNEASLFRHYIVQAFDMKPMMAHLKIKIEQQEEK